MGGGIFYNHFEESHLIVEACEIKDNYAGIGAAIYTEYYLNTDNPFWIEILNCDFKGNKSGDQGGAILLSGEADSKIFAKFYNCNFLNNRSGSYGTALLVGGKQITIDLDYCIFSDNVGMPPNPNGSRYAVYMGGLITESKITNCLFSNNESAIAIFSLQNAMHTHCITNCTFFQNGKYVIDKSNFPFSSGYNNCYITNSIFEDDATFDRMFSDNSLTSASMDGYFIDYSFVSLDDNVTPQGAFGDHVVFKAIPFFVDTANNDFRLQKCSPAVNAGNNLIVDTLGILTDLDGNPRIRFDTVDIGAYETQDSCFTISSKEPQTASISAILSPNPASPGSPLDIQVFGFKHPKIDWIMRDTYGRALASGSTQLIEKQNFTTVSPTSPGIYFIEMRSGGQTVWVKFVVTG